MDNADNRYIVSILAAAYGLTDGYRVVVVPDAIASIRVLDDKHKVHSVKLDSWAIGEMSKVCAGYCPEANALCIGKLIKPIV